MKRAPSQKLKMVPRRLFLRALGAGAPVFAQGVASRGIKPQPRGKPSGIKFEAVFTDIAGSAGLHSPVIYGGVDRKSYILETVGCGCAFFDFDNDGWLDIFLLNGRRLEDKDTPAGTTNRLYKNNRDGTFTDVTAKAGLQRAGWVSGVCIGDYDNDGYDDLFVTYWGQNVLYHNNGDGTFRDVTKAAGLLDSRIRWGAGCTFLDYDRDGRLDLFVSNYVDFAFDKVPRPGSNATCTWKGVPVNCGPRGMPPGSHSLYHNTGAGTFRDVTAQSGIGKARGGYGLTAVAADFDDDGWPDIYVACDSTPSLLFMNNRDGTFREEGLSRGVAVNEDGMEQAGMGLGIGDYDGDGHLDIFKTHFADDTNILYHNDGKGNFDDVTLRSRLGVETRFIGWGAGIVDLDNDGLPDLFLVTGNVYPEIEQRLPDYPRRTPRVIFHNLGGGRFEEVIEEGGPGIVAAHCSRGCAFGDFDNDGDLDVLIVNLNEPPSLLRNDLKSDNHWLKMKLIGVKSNRTAIGARVVVRHRGTQQVQEVLSQSSFLSVNDFRLHFGLGASKVADIEIRWPSGIHQQLNGVGANQILTIKEPIP